MNKLMVIANNLGNLALLVWCARMWWVSDLWIAPFLWLAVFCVGLYAWNVLCGLILALVSSKVD